MRHIATLVLMLNIGAAVYAHDRTVTMTFSGNGAYSSAVNLQQPNTSNVEENVAGNGTLGAFTLRNISAESASPQASNTCSGANDLYFPRVVGAGILRFQDGSLLTVSLTQGGDCVDLIAVQGHCTLTLQISGGTGRFKNSSGTLTYTETAVPVLADALNNPVFFTETGELTGTISGISGEQSQGAAP